MASELSLVDLVAELIHHKKDCNFLADAKERCNCGMEDALHKLSNVDKAINTPELRDFPKAVHLEAVHQVNRWGSAHDEGKSPQDWFWLIGYLAGKALHEAIALQILPPENMVQDKEALARHRTHHEKKLLHHIITTAAVLNNWHSHVLNKLTLFRPGSDIKEKSQP
jgi:hypothetical protein